MMVDGQAVTVFSSFLHILPLHFNSVTSIQSRFFSRLALLSSQQQLSAHFLWGCVRCPKFVSPPSLLPQGNRNAEVTAVPGGFGEVTISSTSHAHESLAAGGWSNNSTLSHRRCNSAPNISSISLSSWRGAGLPCLSSGVLAPGLRDHTIPEGRRFEVRLMFGSWLCLSCNLQSVTCLNFCDDFLGGAGVGRVASGLLCFECSATAHPPR